MIRQGVFKYDRTGRLRHPTSTMPFTSRANTMKKLILFATLTLPGFVGTAEAAVPYIAFPQSGMNLSHLNPIHFSFTASCPITTPVGTPPTLSTLNWTINNITRSMNFHSSASVDFAYALSAGSYTLRVTSSCGSAAPVTFRVN
jgi:hypothetical protein